MLSPLEITSIPRTTSEPDISIELGKRTMSNASVCSRSRSRTSHLHPTADELSSPSRNRSYSGITKTDHIPNGSIVENTDTDKNVELSWQAFEKLRTDLNKAQQDLRKRDDQCKELSKVRDVVDSEVEELTACLFEEANKMCYEANVGRANAEKRLYETQLKLDGLQAEVSALKILVITSTPSNPGKKTHRRAPSAGQICHSCETCHTDNQNGDWELIDSLNKEVDPIIFQSFVQWLGNLCPLKDHPFLTLVHKDDIVPCLRFPNEDLAKSIYKAIQNNTLAIEAITPAKSKKCVLSKTMAPCGFQIKTTDSDQWQVISSSCRARIVAVVDFLTFLRYIRQGIIKKDANELYWQMVKKRADMSLTRLGLQKLDS